MEQELQELESILNRELELHMALCETAELFNNAIKENDIDQMQKHTQEQDAAICTIERLEATRIDCCSKLSKSFKIPSNNTKISSIIDSSSSEWKKRLSSLQDSLKSAMGRLSKVNTSNQILLQEANLIIDKTFDTIRESANPLQSYSAKGKIPARKTGCAIYNNIA